MENDPSPKRPEGAPQTPPAPSGSAWGGTPPDGPTSFLTPSPAAAEKIAAAKLRSLGNRSSGVLLLLQVLCAAVMLVLVLARVALFLGRSGGSPAEIAKALSSARGQTVLDSYLATFWGMILCLAAARKILRQQVFGWWRRPGISLPFFGKCVVLTFGAACAGQILSAAVYYLFGRFGISNGTPNFEFKGDPAVDTVLVVYVCILAPMLEETLFRGMILPRLRPWGDRFAVVVSALLFAIFHMNLVQGIPAFFMGLALGLVAVRSGSVLPGILIHALNNSLSTAFIAAGAGTTSLLGGAYVMFLCLCLVGAASLLYHHQRDFALSDMQQTQAPPSRHRYRAFLLQSGWFWALSAMFALTCVLFALSPQSSLLQKVS